MPCGGSMRRRNEGRGCLRDGPSSTSKVLWQGVRLFGNFNVCWDMLLGLEDDLDRLDHGFLWHCNGESKFPESLKNASAAFTVQKQRGVELISFIGYMYTYMRRDTYMP